MKDISELNIGCNNEHIGDLMGIFGGRNSKSAQRDKASHMRSYLFIEEESIEEFLSAKVLFEALLDFIESQAIEGMNIQENLPCCVNGRDVRKESTSWLVFIKTIGNEGENLLQSCCKITKEDVLAVLWSHQLLLRAISFFQLRVN